MARAGAVRLTAELCQQQSDTSGDEIEIRAREQDLLAEIEMLREEKRRLRQRLDQLGHAAQRECNRSGSIEASNIEPGALRAEELASASHALRNPLNAMVGFADVMKHEVHGRIDNRKYHEYACHICESGHQLLAALEELVTQHGQFSEQTTRSS